MIAESIEYIAQKLRDMNLFEKVYSQVELVVNADDKRIPAYYTSNGKYKPIEYSANNGTAYIRKSSQININESATETYVGCETYLLITIPTRLVAYKKKSELPVDCSYTEDLLAESIMSYLSNNIKDFKSTINANRLDVQFVTIETDSNLVWTTEVGGIDQQDIPYDIACIAIDFNIILLANPKCLTSICDTNG